jgi:hypothetical protein
LRPAQEPNSASASVTAAGEGFAKAARRLSRATGPPLLR